LRAARAIAFVFLSSLCALAAVEAAGRVLVSFHRLKFREFRTARTSGFWADVNPAFGVWHLPNASFHQVTACFDVTYRANSYGARDRERSREAHGARRDVVLGDSFAEGYGASDDDRMTNRLEASSGVEQLNFATGGGFGTIQELVLYRTLASSFEHSGVTLFVEPGNDFQDNNPDFWPKDRYRPYMRRTANGGELYYTVKFEDRDQDILTPVHQVYNAVSNHFLLLNLIRQVRATVTAAPQHAAARAVAPYDQFSDADVDLMGEAIGQLGASASGRPVRVFLIPLREDLEKYFKEGYKFPVVDRLKSATARTPNVQVFDLLPDFAAYAKQHQLGPAAFFDLCASHWTPLGNAVAASAVQHYLYP
jgi:hypothetical protein